MNKINSGQLFALLFLSGLWQAVLCPIQTHSLTGAALAGLVQLPLCALVLHAAEKADPETVLRLHPVLCIGYAAYFLVWGARTLAQVADAVPERLTGELSPAAGAVLLVITCLYVVSKGLHTAARAAVLLLIPAVLAGILLVLGAWRSVDLTRLSPAPEAEDGVRYFCSSGALGAVWLLSGKVRDGAKRAVFGSVLAGLGAFLLLTMLCITAGGRLTAQTRYPFFMLASLSQPMQGQRVDALYLLAGAMLCVFQVAFFTGLAAHTLRLLRPAWRYAPAGILLGMLLLAKVPLAVLNAAAGGLLLPVMLLPALTMLPVKRRAAA